MLALDIHPRNRCECYTEFPRSFKESLKKGEGAHHMEQQNFICYNLEGLPNAANTWKSPNPVILFKAHMPKKIKAEVDVFILTDGKLVLPIPS